MKTAPLFVLLSLLYYQTSYPQTGNSNNKEEQIKKTINNLFYGMKEADSALVASAFSTSAIIQTIVKDKDGTAAANTRRKDNCKSSL